MTAEHRLQALPPADFATILQAGGVAADGHNVALNVPPLADRVETVVTDESGSLTVRVITYERPRRLSTVVVPDREHVVQLLRFCCVGASGYLINLSVFRLLDAWMPYLVAFALAFAVSAGSNFVWNRLWTFSHVTGRPHHQFARFLVVSLGALMLDLALLALLVESVGLAKLPAAAVAIVIVTPLSFLGNKLWSFAQA
jgi:putative flippase GtrA